MANRRSMRAKWMHAVRGVGPGAWPWRDGLFVRPSQKDSSLVHAKSFQLEAASHLGAGWKAYAHGAIRGCR